MHHHDFGSGCVDMMLQSATNGPRGGKLSKASARTNSVFSSRQQSQPTPSRVRKTFRLAILTQFKETKKFPLQIFFFPCEMKFSMESAKVVTDPFADWQYFDQDSALDGVACQWDVVPVTAAAQIVYCCQRRPRC